MSNDIVKVVGKQILDFKNRDTGEMVQGVNLFVLVPDDNVLGMKAVKQFIALSSPAYHQAAGLDFSNGSLDCIFNYNVRVGQKRPVLTSIDVVG